MAKQITLRAVSPELARRLTELAAARGQSVNSVALQLLERATGIDGRRERLSRYTTSSKDDVAEIDRSVALQRKVDPKLWR